LHDLAEIQHAIQQYVLDYESYIHPDIVEAKYAITSQRLAIYREGYYLRLLEVMQQDYEVLAALMGSDAFDTLAREFILAHPSHFRSVRWFGNALPEFMRQHTMIHSQPWLIELAEFEWLLTESFDAADQKPSTLEEMAAVPVERWPEMHFELLLSLRRLSLHWNTVSIWKAFKEEGRLIEPELAEVAASWIIWRNGLETLFYSLTSDAAYMIDAIARGENFSAICEGLCAWVEEDAVAMHAAMLLKRFILDNLITNIIIHCQ
jgi:hypothetical protein